MEIELWKRIKGYENYLISNHGNVKNKKKNKILSKDMTNKGYEKVWLYKDGKKKMFFVHRLVLITFRGYNEDKKLVNHIDQNRKNNNLLNLEWVNPKENSSKEKGNAFLGLELGRKSKHSRRSKK